MTLSNVERLTLAMTATILVPDGSGEESMELGLAALIDPRALAAAIETARVQVWAMLETFKMMEEIKATNGLVDDEAIAGAILRRVEARRGIAGAILRRVEARRADQQREVQRAE